MQYYFIVFNAFFLGDVPVKGLRFDRKKSIIGVTILKHGGAK